MNTEIVVALIAGFALVAAGVPAALIQRSRAENRDDHALVSDILERLDDHLDDIETDIAEVGDKLDGHVNDPDAHG